MWNTFTSTGATRVGSYTLTGPLRGKVYLIIVAMHIHTKIDPQFDPGSLRESVHNRLDRSQFSSNSSVHIQILGAFIDLAWIELRSIQIRFEKVFTLV